MATTFDDLILSAEVEQEQTTKRREKALAEVKYINERVRREGRNQLTEDEDASVTASMELHTRADGDLVGIRKRIAQLREAREREAAVDASLQERAGVKDPKTTAAKPAYDRVARVGSEERTYHRGNDRTGAGFIRDVTQQFLYRNLEAEQRLLHHMQEERVERAQYLERAAGTGAFAGLTVPQYLTDMYAPAVAALRPFADQCNHHDLPPDGMTVNISRITTATSAALQASENAAVSETNIDDTLLTENVQTAAGQQTLSRQAIDRGTGVEGIVMDDLFRRYATVLDSTLINQATTGLAPVSSLQTYTDASPTSPKIYSQIIQGASSVEGTLLGWAQPDLVVMHSRRWYKLLSAVNASWPMIYQAGGNNLPVQATGSTSGQGYAKGIRGQLANGLNVCVDNNVTTAGLAQAITGSTQDHIYVVPSQECHLWEDPQAPVFIRAEQPAAASLGVLLVLYGYFAYSFRRFTNATIVISGTGTVPPVYDGT